MVSSTRPARSSVDLGPLRRAVTGIVIAPDDEGYEAARRLWNGMIDRRPAAIAVVSNADDVRRALEFAVRHGLPVAVRGGGHNVSGSALVDAGLVIDHRGRRAVTVDPASSMVVVEPGALLSDVDAATAPHALSVPVGINTSTGLAGLTLGGGIGWLMREHGLTCDRLVAADVVLANGNVARASEEGDTDLLWALRGGGGNFGVVTRFEFRAVPLEPDVVAGLAWFPLEDGRVVLRRYRDWAATLPRSVTTIVVLRSILPSAPVSADLRGRSVAVVGLCSTDAKAGAIAASGLAGLGTPLLNTVGTKPFVSHQAAIDATVPAGLDYYWKSHFLVGLPDEAIDRLVELNLERPTPWSYTIVPQLGGAVADIAEAATAYASRAAPFAVNINGVGTERAHREPIIEWTRAAFEALAPWSTGGVYVNFMGDEGHDRVEAAYGSAYARLADLKAHYDPHNIFRANQNIQPRG